MNKEFVELLQCPLTGSALTISDDGQYLVSDSGEYRYPIENDIALLLAEHAIPISVSGEESESNTTSTE